MSAPISHNLTDRELRWLRHMALHGPQSSEFLLELCTDTHSCRDTGLRTLQKLRDQEYLRCPPQQEQIAKANFNPNVYDLTRRSERNLRGLGDLETMRPTGHWWHTFLTASLTGALAIECERRGLRYIPAHAILDRSGANLAVPIGPKKLIPDQLFAIDYGGRFRSFVVEVDRGSEPYRSEAARKSLRRMIDHYSGLSAKDALRRHYGLRSPLLVLLVFTAPERAARCLEVLETKQSSFGAVALVTVVPPGFARFAAMQAALTVPWRRVQNAPIGLFD